jgi:hypothetical protein
MNSVYDEATHSRKELLIGMEPVPHRDRKQEDKLTVRHQGQNIFQEMNPSLCHSLGTTRWTETAFFATKRHNMFFATPLANEAKEAKRRDATFQISLELPQNIFRERSSLLGAVLNKSLKVLLDDAVARGEFWSRPLVFPGFVARLPHGVGVKPCPKEE